LKSPPSPCSLPGSTRHSEGGDIRTHLDGEDLTNIRLQVRRTRLPAVVKGSGILLSEPLPGTSKRVTEAVSRIGLEGIVAKHRDSLYQSGERSGAWVKPKLDKQ
jgi:bifunctional non-homologous end joining protein LigD